MLTENLKVRWNYSGESTTCFISTMENNVIAEVSVKRYVTDTPNKRLGRSLSFKRVMKIVADNGFIDKPVRTSLWQQFRNTINQPVMERKHVAAARS